ncbi:MAG: FGGY-family carbohydrate kinase [Lachnospiraceae bacterium]
MKIAGLDIGTTGCKLTVFDETGIYLDKAYCDYPVTRQMEAHEVDAAAIMRGVYAVLTEIGKKHGDIGGIGVTSFGETFVMTDKYGNPLHRSMLYTDPRGREELKELVAAMGEDGERKIASITGLKPHEMYSIAKIMWLKKHHPQIYREAGHLFLIADYVVFCLTGESQIDYSLASRTMAFDIHTLKWSEQILGKAQIDIRLLSAPVPAGTAAGGLKEELSVKTGLSDKTQIVVISHDQVAAAAGAGVFDSGTAVDGAGTVECITPVYDEIPDKDVMFEGNYAVVPYIIPGKYVCYAFSYTGGALIQWCVETMAKKEKELAAEEGISVHEYLERQSESPTGLLVLPHFAGAATPYMDTGSKGAILGLTAGHSVGTIYRACMEGVVYEMMLNMEYLKASGIHFQMLHATGGGAKSKEWMQMKADMLGIPITALATPDAGTVGSAMLTGIAVGCFHDMADAAARMIEKRDSYYPRAGMHKKYKEIYQRYRNMYKAVRPLI